MLACSPFTAGAAAGFSSCPGGGLASGSGGVVVVVVVVRVGAAGTAAGVASRGVDAQRRAERAVVTATEAEVEVCCGVVSLAICRRSVAARVNAICVRCGRPGDEGCLESSDSQKQQVYLFYVLRKVWCCSACTPCQGFPASLNTAAVFNFVQPGMSQRPMYAKSRQQQTA